MKRIVWMFLLGIVLTPLGPAMAEKPRWRDTMEPKRLVPVPDRPPTPGPRWIPSAGLRIDVWLDRGDDATYFPGETVTIHFRTNRDAFVILYDIDTDGDVHRLYPRAHCDEQFVEGGVLYSVPNVRAGYRLVASGPEGYEYIGAVASDEPLLRRWERCGARTIGGTRSDRLGFTSAPTWRVSSDPQLAMDRLFGRLVEVPDGEREYWPETVRDETRFYIRHPYCRR